MKTDEKKSYKEQLDSPQWQRRRLEKMQAADWKCEVCGDGKEKLHVHHRRYESGFSAWQYRDEDLQCLCATCHQLAHMDQRKVFVNAQRIGMKRSTLNAVFLQNTECFVWMEDGHKSETEWDQLTFELMVERANLRAKWLKKINEFKEKHSLNDSPNPIGEQHFRNLLYPEVSA